MPVRTSVGVAVGLFVLTVVGVGTVFGESILAVFAPPPETASSTPSRVTAPAAPAVPPSSGTAGPGAPGTATGDAGAATSGDGSS